MTDQERAQLLELSAEISATENSAWQPACVAAAFRSRAAGEVSFTMQRWIDLEGMRSVLLAGELPESIDDLQAAALVFGLDLNGLELDAAMVVGAVMRDAIADGFAMSLHMEQPEAAPAGPTDGFGDWLPLIACLVSQIGLSLAEARSMEVGQAFALVAGERHNRGWRVAGVPYGVREVETRNAEGGTRNGEGGALQTENCKVQTANLSGDAAGGEEGARG